MNSLILLEFHNKIIQITEVFFSSPQQLSLEVKLSKDKSILSPNGELREVKIIESTSISTTDNDSNKESSYEVTNFQNNEVVVVSPLLKIFPSLRKLGMFVAGEDIKSSNEVLLICYLTVKCWFGLASNVGEFNSFIDILPAKKSYMAFPLVVECFRKFSVYEIKEEAF